MSVAVAPIAPPATVVAAPPGASALRALIRRGLLDNRRAPLVWGGSLGVMCALVVALYPSIRGSLTQLAESYPAGLKTAMGIDDLATLEAFLNAEMFSLLLPLAISYLAIRRVAASIAGAEEQGRLDTLLAMPVARPVFVAGAFLTTAMLVATTLLVVGGLTAASAVAIGEPIATDRLAAALLGVWGLALFFAGCATLAAGALQRGAGVLGIGAGLLAAMYLLDVLGKLAPAAEQLRWLSAFRYLGTPLTSGPDIAGLGVLVVSAALLATLGAVLHQRRDLTG